MSTDMTEELPFGSSRRSGGDEQGPEGLGQRQTTGGLHASGTYLTVTDGLQGAFLFSLAGWDGTSSINIPDLWPFAGAPNPTSNAAIQAVGIYGSATVPEPSTYIAAALLALPVLAQVRRMRKSA